MDHFIAVGQVWKRNGEGFNQHICIGAINDELKVVWANGLGEIVDPIMTFDYLIDTFEHVSGWKASATFHRVNV